MHGFQLTRPVWGEPIKNAKYALKKDDFNSLAPCGANPVRQIFELFLERFQLTRPVWGEPVGRPAKNQIFNISTHSPRVGRTHQQPNAKSYN